MKLNIVNGENGNSVPITINISEYMNVEDIKFKFDDFKNGNGHFTKSNFTLIYKDIILTDGHTIKHYKLVENAKIWIGNIENYLKEEDVLIELFLAGLIPDWMFVIVKKKDKIINIRTILSKRVYPKIIDIWNTKGHPMENDQSISEIDKSGYYKLIVSCDDKSSNTFKECQEIHDKYWVERYLLWDVVRFDNGNKIVQRKLIELINNLRQIIMSNIGNDERLRLNLSQLSLSFVNSRTFRDDMVARINDICEDYWVSEKNSLSEKVIQIFDHYFFWAIHTSLWDYAKSRRCNTDSENKFIAEIIIDTLEYFLKYLQDDNNNWHYWIRLYLDQRLLQPISDSMLNELIENFDTKKLCINIRMNGNNYQMYIQMKPKTNLQLKNAISYRTGIGTQQLYIVKPGGDYKPKDDDMFEEELIIEIVLSMNDIEILRYLDQGGFGDIILCEDKLSHGKFVLKIQKNPDTDLYREISIQHKIRKCPNIMCYWRLIHFEGKICVASKYMSKGSLKSEIQKEAKCDEEIIKIIFQILLQINEMHRLNIIHRDIKCENVVLDDHNNAKLIDFGMAKYTKRLSNEKQMENLKAYKPGTMCYMAPELINQESYSSKIDIWSFGAMIVEIITRKRPYSHLQPIQGLVKIAKLRKIEFEPPKTISNGLLELIHQCLNANQEERPSAGELMKLPLFKEIKE